MESSQGWTEAINAEIRNINERWRIIFNSILSPTLFQVKCCNSSNSFKMKYLHEIVIITFQFSFYSRRQTKIKLQIIHYEGKQPIFTTFWSPSHFVVNPPNSLKYFEIAKKMAKIWLQICLPGKLPNIQLI